MTADAFILILINSVLLGVIVMQAWWIRGINKDRQWHMDQHFLLWVKLKYGDDILAAKDEDGGKTK